MAWLWHCCRWRAHGPELNQAPWVRPARLTPHRGSSQHRSLPPRSRPSGHGHGHGHGQPRQPRGRRCPRRAGRAAAPGRGRLRLRAPPAAAGGREAAATRPAAAPCLRPPLPRRAPRQGGSGRAAPPRRPRGRGWVPGERPGLDAAGRWVRARGLPQEPRVEVQVQRSRRTEGNTLDETLLVRNGLLREPTRLREPRITSEI